MAAPSVEDVIERLNANWDISEQRAREMVARHGVMALGFMLRNRLFNHRWVSRSEEGVRRIESIMGPDASEEDMRLVHSLRQNNDLWKAFREALEQKDSLSVRALTFRMWDVEQKFLETEKDKRFRKSERDNLSEMEPFYRWIIREPQRIISAFTALKCVEERTENARDEMREIWGARKVAFVEKLVPRMNARVKKKFFAALPSTISNTSWGQLFNATRSARVPLGRLVRGTSRKKVPRKRTRRK